MNVLVIHNVAYDLRCYILDRVLKCLSAAGYRTYVISPDNPRYTPLRFSRNYHKWVKYDVESLDAKTIAAYCRRRSIEVVLPADIGSKLLLSQIQHEISPARTFAMTSRENLLLLHNKWRFMQWLDERQLHVPRSQLYTPGQPLDEAQLRLPLIAKPLKESAGKGVQKIDTINELQDYAHAHQRHSDAPFLIQDFIAGEDLVFGVVANNGNIHTWTMQKYCPEGEGHLDFIEHPDLLQETKRIVSELNLHGVFQFDVRVDSEGTAWFIECNPRLWASVAIAMCMGVNYVDLGIKLGMNQPLPAFQPVRGSFTWPERALSRIVRRKLRVSELSEGTRCGLLHELADPAPFLYLIYEWMKHRNG
jgi:carbamoylphosphate synthase large subunit